MVQTIRERARTRATAEFVGRAGELSRLMACLEPDAAAFVVLLHGVAGVGKSALLNRFADEASAHRASVVLIDCRVLEPTEQGFLHGLAESLGVTPTDIDEVVQQLADGDLRFVLALDNYQVFRLLDSWLRLTFVPRLPENVRVVVCGRQIPVAAWTAGTSVHGAVAEIRLGPLPRTDSHELMRRLGLTEARTALLDRLAHGHPLAIRLAAAALAERSGAAIESMASAEVVDELARTFLADVDDPITRSALEAASVVRRMTKPLMSAMVPDVEASAAIERLGALPFVERRRDGLVVHEAVQSAIAAHLHANDPARHRQLGRRAWRYLRDDAREVGRSELWRSTADMLYLIENPVVRDAFFPSANDGPMAVEPARPADDAAMHDIVERHEGPTSARLIRAWRARVPDAFSAVRDQTGDVAGFFCLLGSAVMTGPSAFNDPVVAQWRRHLAERPVPAGQLVMGLRRWLDRDRGELPCPVQAASWLDFKRTYMELRPRLRRIYAVVNDVALYWPIVERLGFRPLTAASGGLGATRGAAAAPGPDTFGPVEVDERLYTSVVLDFGPASVDGWLAGLVASELGVDDPYVLDETARELRADGQVIQLTPLEFGLLMCLRRSEGHAVSRARVLEEVWGTTFDGGSNVIEAVVAGLRRKLHSQRSIVETVRGVGYRLSVR